MNRLTHALVRITTILAVVTVALGTPAAHANWGPEHGLSPTANDHMTVLVDSQLNTHAAWTASSGNGTSMVMAAYRPTGGAWSTPTRLAEASGTMTHLAFAEDDAHNVTLLFGHSRVEQGAHQAHSFTRNAAGEMGSQVPIGHVSAMPTSPDIDSNSRGDLALVWHVNGQIWIRLKPAGQPWSGDLAVHGPDASSPQVEIDDHGIVTVTWVLEASGEGHEVLLWRELPITWSGSGNCACAPVGDVATVIGHQLQVNPQGQRVILRSSRAAGETATTWTAYRNDGNGWTQLSALLPHPSDRGRVALDRAGTAFIALSGSHGMSIQEWTPTGWTSVNLSPADYALLTDLTVDATTGQPVVTWMGAVLQSNLATRAASGWNVLPDGFSPTSWMTTRVSSRGGHMAALAYDYSNSSIRTRQWDTQAPTFTSSLTRIADVGQKADFSATANDWLPSTIHWDFGDGTTATGGQVSHSYTTQGTFSGTVTVTDEAGNSSAVDWTTTVGAPVTGPPPATVPTTPLPTTAPPTTAPVAPSITGATLSRRAISIRRKPRTTTLRLTLDTPATVVLTFKRKGKKKSKPVRIRQSLEAGTHAIKIKARLTEKARLRPGRYVIVAKATNTAGTSEPARVTLRVRR